MKTFTVVVWNACKATAPAIIWLSFICNVLHCRFINSTVSVNLSGPNVMDRMFNSSTREGQQFMAMHAINPTV